MTTMLRHGWFKPSVALVATLAMMFTLVPATIALAEDNGEDDGPTGTVEQEVLTDDVQEAMSLAVLPDGRVLHNARSANPDLNESDAPFRLYDPETDET